MGINVDRLNLANNFCHFIVPPKIGSGLADFFEMSDELIRLANAPHAPPGVKLAVARLAECEKKLFCWMLEVEPALGATECRGSFQPSDFLCELVEAARSFDWPKFGELAARQGKSAA